MVVKDKQKGVNPIVVVSIACVNVDFRLSNKQTSIDTVKAFHLLDEELKTLAGDEVSPLMLDAVA